MKEHQIIPGKHRSYRWHFTHDGRGDVPAGTYVVYTDVPSKNDAEVKVHNFTLVADTACKVRYSGYYDYDTNMIIDPQDGPLILKDWK